jgi:hypothetical protein
MFKSSLAILIFYILSSSVFAQELSKVNYYSLSFRKKLNNFFFKENPPKIYNEPSTKKNLIYLQVLGDTPWIGVGYSRRLYTKSKYLIEGGTAIGLTPKFFNNHIPEPSLFSFSHHTRIVFRLKKLISPTLAYSGVWYSGEFHKEKMFNYRPSPILGVRLGNSNSCAVNLNWCGYFYKQDFIRLDGQGIVERGHNLRLLGLPSANFQFSF